MTFNFLSFYVFIGLNVLRDYEKLSQNENNFNSPVAALLQRYWSVQKSYYNNNNFI